MMPFSLVFFTHEKSQTVPLFFTLGASLLCQHVVPTPITNCKQIDRGQVTDMNRKRIGQKLIEKEPDRY